eukprot:3768187-Pyramimonas_sp.AAC.1
MEDAASALGARAARCCCGAGVFSEVGWWPAGRARSSATIIALPFLLFFLLLPSSLLIQSVQSTQPMCMGSAGVGGETGSVSAADKDVTCWADQEVLLRPMRRLFVPPLVMRGNHKEGCPPPVEGDPHNGSP